MNKERVKWLDCCRGIGIILVCLGHVLRGLQGAGLFQNIEIFKRMDFTIYSFHMPLFFFLSGLTFLITPVKRYGSFFLKKFLDLYLVFIFWALLQSIVKIKLEGLVNTPESHDFWKTFFYKPGSQFWFIYTLFILHLFWGFIYQKLQNKKQNIITPSLIVTLLFIFFLKENPYTWYSIFFITGISMRNFFSSIKDKPPALTSLSIVFFGICIYLIYFNVGNLFNYENMNKIILASSGVCASILISLNIRGKILPYFTSLGSKSLQIYILSIFFGSGTRIILLKLGIRDLITHIILGTTIALYGSVLATTILTKLNLNFLFQPSILLKKYLTSKTGSDFSRSQLS